MVAPDSGDARLEVLGRLIEAHLNFVNQQLGPEVEVKPGSPCAIEQATSEEGPGGPWTDEPSHTAFSVVNLKLMAAKDHLLSLRKLLEPPITLFGPMTMARASIEASAAAYWLLDPAIPVRQRVARSLGDRLDSAEERANAFRLFIDGWSDDGAGDSIRVEASELGVKVQKPPTLTQLVGEVMTEHMPSLERGKGLYKFMSAISHGTDYAVLHHFREVGPADDPRSHRIEGYVPIQGIEWSVTATLGAHTSAIDRAIAYCGLDRWAWDGWMKHVGKVLHANDAAMMQNSQASSKDSDASAGEDPE
jgi:hypothetical protein